jgi:hypothetical protein
MPSTFDHPTPKPIKTNPMTNPIPYIRNKFCFWLTGLTHDEIANLIDKVNEVANKNAEDNDYISKSDFDPDDYDFSPLRDYDFSEFLTPETVDEQIECYLNNADYITKDYLDDELEEQVRDLFNNASPAPLSVDDIRKEIQDAIKELSKKKKKKKDTKPKAE